MKKKEKKKKQRKGTRCQFDMIYFYDLFLLFYWTQVGSWWPFLLTVTTHLLKTKKKQQQQKTKPQL